MKKTLLRSVSLMAALLITASSVACKGESTDTGDSTTPPTAYADPLSLTKVPAGEVYETSEVSFELSMNSISNGTFGAAELNPDRKANKVTFAKKVVSSLQLNKQFADGATVTVDADISAPGEQDGKGSYNTLHIGVRLTDPAKDPTVNNGIWFTLSGNKLGMRRDKWPGTVFTDSPVDFTDAHVRIVDDPATNIINFYATGTDGKEVHILEVKIEGQMVRAFEPGTDNCLISNRLSAELPKNGYVKFWVHHAPKSIVAENVVIKGTESVFKKSNYTDMLFSKDVFADTWVATDDEGRFIGQNTKDGIGAKQVGMFYFLCSSNMSNLYDHSATYYGDDNGANGVKRLEMLIAEAGSHYWAQPYFGYYDSSDEWIIRKHAYMLKDAGVDFIFLDITNGITFRNTYETLFKVYSEMREEGYDTPKVMFHCGTISDNVTRALSEIYVNIYSNERYRDIWFMWEGKPLVFADDATVATMSGEIKEKFTFRDSWAYTSQPWYTDTDGKGCWPWADPYPQEPGYSNSGKLEQMVVMSGYWANSEAGRSYSGGRQPRVSEFSFSLTTDGTSGKGIAYQEQFDRALETDPGVLMLIGWNEWSAGRHSTDQLKNDGQLIAGTYRVDSNDSIKKYSYIDCFSPEYSRDVEPVSGLFKDNYYYQTALNVRDYKGTRALAGAFGQKDIDMSAGAYQWYTVGPEFRDYEGDVTHRDFKSSILTFDNYVNKSGRNDFVTAKVSVSGDNVYFMAECANDITAAEGTNWMNLFVDADCNASTGWYGYDYVINRSQNGNKASVEALATTEKNAEWSLSNAGDAEFTVSGNMIVIKVAKSTIKVGDTFDFKWADNSVADGKEIMQFLDLGDAAPNGRYNYRYTTANETVAAPSCLESSMVVFKANSYNAYVNGAQVMINAENTKITALGQQGTVYLPKAFVEGTLGYAAGAFANAGTYCGEMYVSVTADAVAAQGKVLTVAENGLIVIADKEITDTATIRTLYRSLM